MNWGPMPDFGLPAEGRGPEQPRSSLPEAAPRSVRFRREREAEWKRLEGYVQRALTSGLQSLAADELEALSELYRSAVASLEVARKTALDRALVQYLETLTARAYLAIYASRRPERGIFARLFFDDIPRAARALAPEIAISTAFFAFGVAIAFALYLSDSAWFFAFVDPGLAGDRGPGASTESLRQALYDTGENLTFFSGALFNHNAGIGLTAFAVGIAAGIPTGYLIFQNGLMLGAFMGLYYERGLLVPLLGWLLPHGVPELGAIILCGGAGFAIARSILFPGIRSVRESLAHRGRRAAVLVTGCVFLFLVAGVIEGIFRQSVQNDIARFSLAAFNAAWLFLWLGMSGRKESKNT